MHRSEKERNKDDDDNAFPAFFDYIRVGSVIVGEIPIAL